MVTGASMQNVCSSPLCPEGVYLVGSGGTKEIQRHPPRRNRKGTKLIHWLHEQTISSGFVVSFAGPLEESRKDHLIFLHLLRLSLVDPWENQSFLWAKANGRLRQRRMSV